jgi:hypothetical protein
MKKNYFFIVLLLLTFSSSFMLAQTYVGSGSCQACHDNATWDFIYTNWSESGHPYKFSVINDSTPPVYPLEALNFQSSWMSGLGDGTLSWDNIAGVIGGYGWKVRFVGNDGHIIGTAGSMYSTGLGHNQFNFAGGVDHGWVDYHPGDEKIYNYSCFKCHTTGGDTLGTWLPNVPGLGTFSEGGVGCEACHGPGSAHIAAPSASNIDRVYEQAHQDNSIGGLSIDGVVKTPDGSGDDVTFMCGTCHNRSYTDPINSSGGFIKHHEQWDEFIATKHNLNAGHDCITCHDPHKRGHSGWGPAIGAIKVDCGTCHNDQVATINHTGTQKCIDCHMPYAVKSGTSRGQSGYKGDVRSHLFVINPDTASMFTPDGSAVLDDGTRSAALSPHFACLGCHNDDPGDAIPDYTIDEVSAAAIDMHTIQKVDEIQKDLSMQIYPNPTRDVSNISFTLNNSEAVTLEIYDAAGNKVNSIVHGYKAAGNHEIFWNGNDQTGAKLQSGIYIVLLYTKNASTSKKLVVMN